MPKELDALVLFDKLYSKSLPTTDIQLDSPEWFAWLEQHVNFRYQGDDGILTVRYEQSKSGKTGHWRAYRACGKTTKKLYLSNVTRASLEQASYDLLCPDDHLPIWAQRATKIRFPDSATIQTALKAIYALGHKTSWSKGDREHITQIAEAALRDLLSIRNK